MILWARADSPALSLSATVCFSHIHFSIPQKLTPEHPSYGYHVTGWQVLGHSWDQREERGEVERKETREQERKQGDVD